MTTMPRPTTGLGSVCNDYPGTILGPYNHHRHIALIRVVCYPWSGCVGIFGVREGVPPRYRKRRVTRTHDWSKALDRHAARIAGALSHRRPTPARADLLKPRHSSSRRLRLSGTAHTPSGKGQRGPIIGQPISGAADPRWVLAVRTAELLEGAILPPEKRDRLNRLGRIQGLSPFAVSLIIAIVQDQARRGYSPQDCPTAGEPQLRMVALHHDTHRRRRAISTAVAVTAFLALELIILKLWVL